MRMRATAATAATVATVMLAAGLASAEGTEAKLSLDASSAYVYRGVTLNDGLVIQPALEVYGLPVDLGIWANFDLDDYDGTLTERQFSELDLYVSYTLPIERVESYICLTEYVYPLSDADADRELTLGLSYPFVVEPFLTVNYGLDGAIRKSWYLEAGLGAEHSFRDGFSVEGKFRVGYAMPDAGPDGFSHCQATLGLTYGILNAAIHYVGQLDDDVLPDGDALSLGYDVDMYGTIGLGFDF